MFMWFMNLCLLDSVIGQNTCIHIKKKVDLFVNLALTNAKTQNLENEIKLLYVCLGGK